MKNLIYAALLVLGSIANADVYCSISGQNPKDKDTFDQTILNAKKIENHEVIVVKDGKIIDVNFENLTLAQWQKIDGASMVSFDGADQKALTIVLARINTRDLTNMTKVEAAASGDGALTSLVSYQSKFALSCARL